MNPLKPGPADRPKSRARPAASPVPRSRLMAAKLERIKTEMASQSHTRPARCPGCACSGSPRDLALCRPPLVQS